MSLHRGERLLPQILDTLADNDPKRVYAAIPLSSQVSDGFQDITMARLANAVNRLCWWIQDRLGTSTAFDTIAYLGIADIRYTIVFLASVKCGWKALFLSPRNPARQNVKMVEQAECRHVLYSKELDAIARAVVPGSSPIKHLEMPALDNLVDETPVESYKYQKPFAQAQNDPALVLHSSGSTGDPKTTTMTHGCMASSDFDRLMPTPPGRRAQNASQFDFEDGGRIYSCFPPYHLAGVQIFIMQPLFSERMSVVMGPPVLPPSGELVHEIMKQQRLRALYLPPSIIEQWASESGAIDQARDLEFVLFGGGPLSPLVGRDLEKVTSIRQMFGGLETGALQLLIPNKEDWNWLEFNPLEDYDFQQVDDGLYELVIHNTPEYAKTRPLFHNYPDVKIWRTRDLFASHPSKKGLWRFVSRVDDTVVLSSGHKVQSPPLETIIQGCPHLSGVLIVGHGRPQPALIVEPKKSYFDEGGSKEGLLQETWTYIEAANREAPSYAKIMRTKIIVASLDKPFIRAPKGTVVRRSTAEQFKPEIESLYAEDQDPHIGPSHVQLSEHLLQGAKGFVRSILTELLPHTELEDTGNFFFAGVDSLICKDVAQHLQSGMPKWFQLSNRPITAKMIYRHPTISSLAEGILQLVQGIPVGEFRQDHTIENMKETVEKFTKDLSIPKSIPAKRKIESEMDSSQGIKALLLGPRGRLGPQILRHLMNEAKVAQIYCLSRGDEPLWQLQKSLKSRFPHDDLQLSKLTTMKVDLEQDRLGLSQPDWATLINNVNLIIHNAWKVDFRLTLESFEVQLVRSVRSVIELSCASFARPRIVFLSSVASVSHWPPMTSDPVPESPVYSYEAAPPHGYGQSKHVAERILAIANEHIRVPVTILRLGQVAGPTVASEGTWSQDEWVPRLAILSKSIKAAPTGLPKIDWIPVNEICRIISEICIHDTMGLTTDDKKDEAAALHVYNLANTQQSQWLDFVEVLEKRMDTPPDRLPFSEWVHAIYHRFSENEAKDPVGISAVKILPYFQYLSDRMQSGPFQPEFDKEKAIKASPTMANLRSIQTDMMDMWCQQWGI